MLIRINLLAEQIEAEDARRRDPVKRAVFMGAAFAITLLLFSASLQYRLRHLRQELNMVQAEVLDIEPQAKSVRADLQRTAEIEERGRGLATYANSRLFWAEALDALQRTVVDNVRVMSLATAQAYSTNAEYRFRTNYIYPKPVASKWKFWSSPTQADFSQTLTNQLAVIATRPEFVTNRLAASTKILWTKSPARHVAAVEITRPAAATERVQLTIEARDYSDPPGQRVDEFLRVIATSPYFKERVQKGEGRGVRVKQRGIRPEYDPQDGANPRPFIPFSIECHYEETLRTNE